MEQTEKTVKRTSDGLLPEMIREKIRDQLEHILPREIKNRVEKATDEVVQLISQNIVSIIDSTAQKQIPKVARERLPEMAKNQLDVIAESTIPKLVNSIISREVDKEFERKMIPTIHEAISRIRKKVMPINILILIIAVITLIFSIYFSVISPRIAEGRPIISWIWK
jgi:hypothetical protein